MSAEYLQGGLSFKNGKNYQNLNLFYEIFQNQVEQFTDLSQVPNIDITPTMFHEIGHSLGINLLWRTFNQDGEYVDGLNNKIKIAKGTEIHAAENTAWVF